MELPAALRRAVDEVLAGHGVDELGRAAEALSARYRAEVRDGRWHVADALSARAYAAARLPATYAASRAAAEAVHAALPDFAPLTALDIGAGPGSATWAAADRWPSLRAAELIEGSAEFRALGERFSAFLPFECRWRTESVEQGLRDAQRADLVLLAYVLDELAPAARDALVDRLWQLASGALLIVEPGTPAGWKRILAARARLVAAGAHLAAPCPHAAACPLAAPDWCHFSRTVARSRIHRLAKGAEVPWEEEKYIYLAVARVPAAPVEARVLAPPRTASGRVWLKLCQADGRAAEPLITRREGERFKAARRLEWGDTM